MPDLLTVFSFALGLLPEKARAIFQQKAGLNRALLALLSSDFMKEVKAGYETGVLTLDRITQMSKNAFYWSLPHREQPIEKHDSKSWSTPYQEPFRINSRRLDGKAHIFIDRECDTNELAISITLFGIHHEIWVGFWLENLGFIETRVSLDPCDPASMSSTGRKYIPFPEGWGWAKEGQQLANIEAWVVILS